MKAVSGACGPAVAQSRRTLMVEDVPSASWSEQGVVAFFERLYGPACVYSCVCVGRADQDLHPSARAAAHLIQVNTGPATAFVTLRSAERCTEAQQVVLSHTSGWRVCEAPEPRDLIWSNVVKPRGMTELHQKIGLAASVVCVLFWSVPVTLIQAWANVESLSQWVPAVHDLKGWSPTLYALITSYLPVLALMGLQALLPYFFAAMARSYEGHKTKSGVERVVTFLKFSEDVRSPGPRPSQTSELGSLSCSGAQSLFQLSAGIPLRDRALRFSLGLPHPDFRSALAGGGDLGSCPSKGQRLLSDFCLGQSLPWCSSPASAARALSSHMQAARPRGKDHLCIRLRGVKHRDCVGDWDYLLVHCPSDSAGLCSVLCYSHPFVQMAIHPRLRCRV